MNMNRWKLVAGVLGLSMCGLAALAEPACRNMAPVYARMPEEKKPEVPLPGRKPVKELELPSLPPPPVVTVPMSPTESLPVPGSPKVDFPAVSGLPVPSALPPDFKEPELPPALEKPPVTVPYSEAKNLAVPKLVEPLPEKPSTQKFTELPSPILLPTKMNDPVKMAEEFSKFPPLPDNVALPKSITGHKLETGEVIINTPLPQRQPGTEIYTVDGHGEKRRVNPPLPPPSLEPIFTPPPILAVADTRPVPTKPLTAAIDPAPVAPPQLTPRIVSEEVTPLRPVSVEKKLRVQLNLGSGKPWLEIRDNEELVLKVVAEAVEVKAVGEGTEGLNVLKATGGVSFRTLGGNGTCDELRVVPGTGEVQLSGKVVVTSNWGKAETTATAEKMTFRLGSEPVKK